MPNLRSAKNSDSKQLIHLIDTVYREYGDQICLEGADQDLLDLATHYEQAGGAFVVLQDGGQVVGSHAVKIVDPAKSLCTFRRLYLLKEYRGGRWGDLLMSWAIDWASEQGLKRVVFWSDVRFKRAHQFFTRFDFEKTGRQRTMNDGVEPYDEYEFEKSL